MVFDRLVLFCSDDLFVPLLSPLFFLLDSIFRLFYTHYKKVTSYQSVEIGVWISKEYCHEKTIY